MEKETNVIKQAERKPQLSETVVVEASQPCYVNLTYYPAGVRFMADRQAALQLVAENCAFIVEDN